MKRRGTSLWDAHEETPIRAGQGVSSLQTPAGSCQQMEQLKTLNQGGGVNLLVMCFAAL